MIPDVRLIGGVPTRLVEIEGQIWTTLQRAATQRRHDWTTPVFVTSAVEGPQARTVVLRQVDPLARRVTLFTDVRAAKVGEIAANPRVSWLFWDHASKTQLRVAAIARLAAPAATRNALKSLAIPQWSDYVSRVSPGAPWVPGADATEESLIGRTFAVIETTVKHIDWLKLDREGNVRAHFDYTDLAPTARWIVP